MSKVTCTLAVAVVLALASSAEARMNGVITKSGNDGGIYCTDCHNTGSGKIPTVEFSGPDTVAAGEKNRYSFTVTPTGSHTAAGFNVAADDGTFATVTADTQLTDGVNGFVSDSDELTHTEPHALSNGSVIFEFDWTAPKKAGTFKLYGAGNAVNENGFNTGDDPNKTTMDITVTCPDGDGDGYPSKLVCPDDAEADCNDADDAIHPGAAEDCDDLDNDCNGEKDDGINPDADADGHAPRDAPCATGTPPPDDCDDNNRLVRPGRAEICDGIDNNCDDMKLPTEVDADGDTYFLCVGASAADCDDTNASVNPGVMESVEMCEDGIDQDCKGGDRTCPCPDEDEDGFALVSCGGTDCDDTNADVNPGSPEECDGIDQDCDEQIDEGISRDLDGDEHFDVDSECGTPRDDCNDNDSTIHPGAAEICGDAKDQDCQGGDQVCPACQPADTQDCYDGPADTKDEGPCHGGTQACIDGDFGPCEGQVVPATEVCENDVDEDCDGVLNDGCETGTGGDGGTGGTGGTPGTGGFGGAAPPATEDSGCGCGASSGGPAGALLLAAVLLLRRRR